MATFVCCAGVSGQSVFQASGGDLFGVNGSVSYSIGQVFHTEATSGGGSLFAGVQVPIEVAAETGTAVTERTGVPFSIYPNPATEQVTITTDQPVRNQVTYALYDMSGREVASDRIRDVQTEIGIGHLDPSVYLLTISGENGEVSSFKIIKK